jgi:hypothetical protein
MTESIDDRLAAAIAHDGVIVRAISSSAPTIARAWETSAVRCWSRPIVEAFRPLTAAERLRHGLVALAAAVITRLLLLLL